METLIIIGAMKAGTSTLFNLLSQHPEICPSQLKEPEYFSPYGRANISNYDELWAFDPAKHRYRMEASTGYSKERSRDVPRKIKAYGIQPKLIYILRDPFMRIESHYNFMRRSFAQDWSARIDDNHLIDASDYIRHIDNFLSEFEHHSLLLVDFRMLSEKPNSVMQNIYSFLEIEPLAKPIAQNVSNVTKHEITFTEAWLRRRLEPLRSRLPMSTLSLGKAVLRRFPKTGRKVVLTQMQRKRIHDQLHPGMMRLEVEHGFDVAQWGFVPEVSTD